MKVAYACLACLLFGIVDQFAVPGDKPDPSGTWGVYYGENEQPTWTLVIKPIKHGWQTQWAGAGNVLWVGMMHVGDEPDTLIEHWQSPDHGSQVSGARGAIKWLWQDGGGIEAEARVLNFRKQ